MAAVLSLCLSTNSFAQDEYYDDPAEPNRKLEENVENLSSLEEAKDIAVIQKKYLDKTGRWELWGAGAIALNSQYFNFVGLSAKGSYHFSERWAVEAQYMFLSDLEKSITDGLKTDQAIQTRDIVTPTSYYGVNLRWSPIFGKMTLREKSINPFELYFTGGVGFTGTDDGQSAFTITGGLGQVYPMSKNTSFRWALALHNYSADAKGDLKGEIRGQTVRANFLYVSAGVSVYFPFSEKR
jgi:outer membrane beta-barrel protein